MTELKKQMILLSKEAIKDKFTLLFSNHGAIKLEFRELGIDQFIVSIPMILGNKLELVVNYKGEVIEALQKQCERSNFKIMNNDAHSKEGLKL